jgi:tetraacyldisaccharide-1-P 4'-kinase
MLDKSLRKIDLFILDDFRKSFQLHRPLELLASQERNEIDGSEGAIITLLDDS